MEMRRDHCHWQSCTGYCDPWQHTHPGVLSVTENCISGRIQAKKSRLGGFSAYGNESHDLDMLAIEK